MVSQFGILRLRKSVHPAIPDNSTAPTRIVVFKPAPARAVVSPPILLHSYAIEKAPFLRAQEPHSGKLLRLSSIADKHGETAIARIFTQAGRQVNELTGTAALPGMTILLGNRDVNSSRAQKLRPGAGPGLIVLLITPCA
jgi:hypothetical protein